MKKIPIRQLSASQKEPDASPNFAIRNEQALLAGKDMVEELHRHDFFFLLALEKGAGAHEIDFTSYPVTRHTIFFLRPGQVHQLVLKAGSVGYLMQFDGAFYRRDAVSNQLLRKAGTRNHYQPDAAGFQKLLSILRCIFEEYSAKRDNYQQCIKAHMDLLLIELGRQQSASPSGNGDLYMQERLETFMELLATNISEHKQVADYAAMMNCSPWQLNAITKTTMNKTSSELINEYIILEAKRNLLATSSQVTQIAGHLGYEDASYFIRFFKKHTGYSPEAFRNNFR